MNSEIQTLVESFSAQLSQLVRRTALEQVVAALGGTAPTAKRGPGRPKMSAAPATSAPSMSAAPKAKRGGKRIRRTDADLAQMGAAILAHVKANPGQRGEMIAAALGTDVGTMRKPMLDLIAKKKVKTTGQRRGMSYAAR